MMDPRNRKERREARRDAAPQLHERVERESRCAGSLPPAQQGPVLTTRVMPISPMELVALARMGHSADEWIAVEMDVPTFSIQGQQPDGSKVWTATFITPPSFFQWEDSKLLGPNGQPANIMQQFQQTFVQGVFPAFRTLVRRAKLGAHVPMPPAASQPELPPATQAEGTQLGFEKAPDRYMQEGRETIDQIRDSMTDTEFVGFCRGNSIKYRSRAGAKDGDLDASKAIWYERMARHAMAAQAETALGAMLDAATADPRCERPDFKPYVRQ